MKVFGPGAPAAVRLTVALAVGVVAVAVVATTAGWPYAPAAGWIATAGVYLAWTWRLVGPMDDAQAKYHATKAHEEDATRRVSQVVVLLAAIGSLAGVGYLLAAESAKGGNVWAATVGVLSVTASWFSVHTIYALRYARLYYTDDSGGVDFNQDEEPNYVDFAYLAFTIGMTYQVSDTNLKTRAIRATALSQAMLSFLLGAIILAITINLVAGLVNLGG
ncbi:DUF1345 domain-containing protein [Mycolicibacterium komossense]|uniref:DUF1345 domain-containing protein n=1 Tax=Mycolicibacterium komossense TaxID=1779 RepID=A0ABT3CLJ9_9MYCO|nr:DUF1345 domain-containing protein [Mycolicibacterium komossense]MCV7230327.1 DUF1345 domain-containing protein [Mycolicibacterium komossense]